jgi:hypothetical protein
VPGALRARSLCDPVGAGGEWSRWAGAESHVAVRTDSEQGSHVAQTLAGLTNANHPIRSGESWSCRLEFGRTRPPTQPRQPTALRAKTLATPSAADLAPPLSHEARPTSHHAGSVGAGGEWSRWAGAESHVAVRTDSEQASHVAQTLADLTNAKHPIRSGESWSCRLEFGWNRPPTQPRQSTFLAARPRHPERRRPRASAQP